MGGVMFDDLRPPYRTIVADPPWEYRNTRGTQTRSTRGRSAVTAADHYTTLPVQGIADLPVGDLAAPNAHLYLWVPTPLLLDHPGPNEILQAWGFRYVTLITWVKTGAPGLGFAFRVDTEHALFGVRGAAPIPPERRESNVVVAPRRGHSVKPAEFGDLVERVSPGPYVELFARQSRLGWDSWGRGYEGAA